MRPLIVVDNPARWPLEIPGVEVVAARAYLTQPEYSTLRGALVFNICRSYAYQRTGYYVSLLAEARGHRPIPSVATLQDLRDKAVTRLVSSDLSTLIERSFSRIQSSEFVLSVYFGRPLAQSHGALARALFNQFPAPLLRARFEKDDGEWQLVGVGPIATAEIPENHRPFVREAAERYFAGRRTPVRRRKPPRFHLAILVDSKETSPPSNERALDRFERAAQSVGIGVEHIEREDYGRVPEFDGLFLRTTTAVNHYTYRFARRAAAEGIVVIDDPRSIIRCGNKVYLSELLERQGVRQPKTRLVHQDNQEETLADIGLPCVLKQPDSSFSRGVVLARTVEDREREVARLLADSEIVVAQEFLPTEFDWRVGVLDRRPLYVCRYHMAKNHWQIMKHQAGRETEYGKVDTLHVGDAPRAVVHAALRAANAVGDGLYGVDVKQRGRSCFVMEVNDNPNLDGGFEDKVLKDDLWLRLADVFLARMEARRA